MFFSSDSIVAITINEGKMTAAEFKKSHGEPELVAVSTVVLPPGVLFHGEVKEKDRFEKCLRDVLNGARPRRIRSKNVVFVLPESQVYLTLIHFLGAKSQEEILLEAPKEALATIPLDYRQIYCDYFIAPNVRKEKRSEVVYAACDKNVANSYLEILLKMGLKPVFFAIEPDALLSSLALQTDVSSVLVLVLGETHSYWIVTEGDLVKKVLPMSINIKETDLNVSSKAFDSLVEQAEAFLSSYQTSEEKAVLLGQLVVWSGQRFKDVGLFTSFVQGIGKKLKMTASIMTDRFSGEDPFVNIAYGAARRFFQKNAGQRSIDLLPRLYHEQAAMVTLGSFVTALSLMCLVASSALTAVSGYVAGDMYFEKERAYVEKNAIDKNINNKSFDEVKNKTKRFNEEVAILSSIQSRLPSYSLLWEALEKSLSDGRINITSMYYTAKSLTFEITGIAAARNDITALRDKLKKMPIVEEVLSPLSNLDKTANISFLLKIKLNSRNIPYLGT